MSGRWRRRKARPSWRGSSRFARSSCSRSTRRAAHLPTRASAAPRLAPALAMPKSEYVAYPYPVTPWHEDYAYHVDLVEVAKARVATAGAIPRLRISRSVSGLAPGPAWRPAGGEWDATLEEVPLDQLLRQEATRLDGWMGPPWLKQGWFHAHALSARAV